MATIEMNEKGETDAPEVINMTQEMEKEKKWHEGEGNKTIFQKIAESGPICYVPALACLILWIAIVISAIVFNGHTQDETIAASWMRDTPMPTTTPTLSATPNPTLPPTPVPRPGFLRVPESIATTKYCYSPSLTSKKQTAASGGVICHNGKYDSALFLLFSIFSILYIVSNMITVICIKRTGKGFTSNLVAWVDGLPAKMKMTEKRFSIIMNTFFFTFWFVWVAIECGNDEYKWRSVFGLFVFIFISWIFSEARSEVKARPVVAGLFLQWLLGYFVMKTGFGGRMFDTLGDAAADLIDFTLVGAEFVFGQRNTYGLVINPYGPIFESYTWPTLAFNVLPSIIFFSGLVNVLYYLGIIQIFISGISTVMVVTMGTSGAETLVAAGNIFVGMTESPLLVKPFLAEMTDSEIFVVMTAGLATIAGGVLATFIGFLGNVGVNPAHLMTASVMSAPAALALSKVWVPEQKAKGTPKTAKGEITGDYDEIGSATKNELGFIAGLMSSFSSGVIQGGVLMMNVIVLLVGFLAMLAFVDSLTVYLTTHIGLFHKGEVITLTKLFSWLFYPFAWLMGVPTSDCTNMGTLLGIKTFVNEFVAYESFTPDYGGNIRYPLETARANLIATYALCGFANFGSIGILIGGIGALVPSKKDTLIKYGLRAMIAGTLAAFMTACIAGILEG